LEFDIKSRQQGVFGIEQRLAEMFHFAADEFWQKFRYNANPDNINPGKSNTGQGAFEGPLAEGCWPGAEEISEQGSLG